MTETDAYAFIKDLIESGSLEGNEVSKIVSVAFFALSVYEYLITMDQEIEYFWTGPWTTSRILFFINRYLPLCLMAFTIICVSLPNPLEKFCKPAIQTALIMNVIAVGVIQAILVTRVWYIFPDCRFIRIGMIFAFAASIVSSFVLVYTSSEGMVAFTLDIYPDLLGDHQFSGCHVTRPPYFWHSYIPSLVLHTILYVLTAVRALKNRRLLVDAPVLQRLLRDGGFFYFVVLGSVGYTAIGSTLTSHPLINITAIFSHVLMATTSIAMSRVLFSIHSLAANIGSSSAWLLNNVELSRVKWKKGAHEGEILVDYNTIESCDSLDLQRNNGRPMVKTTHVGVIHEPTW